MAGTGIFAEIIDGDVFKYYADGEWKKSSSAKSVAILNPTTRNTHQYKPDMRIAWEEPFCPLLPVIRIGSVEEGIHHCNASNFGLQGCVTKDINKAMLINDAMETGTVQINSAPARGPIIFLFRASRIAGSGHKVSPIG